MPDKRLPNIPFRDVASLNSKMFCYVTIGECVYNVTSFLPDHLGRGHLILEYGGKDVSEIIGDELSHIRSEAGYETLEENLVRFVANDATISSSKGYDRPENIIPLLPNPKGTAALKAYGSIGRDLIFATPGVSGMEDLSKETNLNADFETHQFLDLN
ncbi:MAG: fatty acid alpha-hydroxylase [Alectoria sarmentosa]|nr:MAG: fatty acid alpha-hydroxylase [Alectoria sarmentosa]CAD6591962.1 MAG: fatty acid alpha-hydroxylase [Alectoria sarmentosa]